MLSNVSYSGYFNDGVLHGASTKSVELSPGKFEKSIAYFLDGEIASEREWNRYTRQQDKNCKITEPTNNSAQEKAIDSVFCKQYKQRKQIEVEQSPLTQSEASKPKCMKIRFTGYAAIYPQHLLSVQRSKHPNELIADHPIVCNDSEWGGHYLDTGEVINRNHRTECIGIGYFRNQLADINGWKDDSYHVSSVVQFNTRRRLLPLYIWKKNAKCVK